VSDGLLDDALVIVEALSEKGKEGEPSRLGWRKVVAFFFTLVALLGVSALGGALDGLVSARSERACGEGSAR
jgi:hypothetical protein